MTTTRILQIGAELNTTAEWPATATEGTTAPTISNTKARTGVYSVRSQAGSLNKPVGVAFSGVTQIRAGVWLNHNNVFTGTNDNGNIFRWTTSAGTNNYVYWKGSTGLLSLVIAGTVVTTISVAAAGISVTDTWYHIGLTLFADATTGWASVYVNGAKILEATGINTGTSITEMYFAGNAIANGWQNYAYFDDFYVDSAEGEADGAVPQKRFLWGVANGNGASSQWSGNDGNSVNNYLLVDDVTPDGDTTYVYTQAVDQKDTYALADITVPVGYVIVAAIPTALAKRAGVTEELKLVTFDGTTTVLSAAKVPAASYAPVWDRQETQPDASAWNETDLNAMEFGQQSAGAF